MLYSFAFVLLYDFIINILKEKDKDKLLAFELTCFRRTLLFRLQQKIRNEEVWRRVNTTRKIVQMIMKRKLSRFGYVCRMGHGRLSKRVAFGMMDSPNR